MPGTLFVVATPIGNLEDLTFRALRTLREVDLIAAEDTRRTSKLLAHYQVQKPLVSLREHNEAKQGARLVADLVGGKQIALVTDAGTPGIADPGARFVRLTRERGIQVVPIPGCSAVTTALSASGFDSDQFVFAGFAPAGGRAIDWLNDIKTDARTVVFFETPHSINTTIGHIERISIERPIIVWRELTKIHEESVELDSNPRHGDIRGKGEFVVVVGPATDAGSKPSIPSSRASEITSLFDYLTKYPTIDEASALAMVGCHHNLKPSEVRKAVKKHRISVKQQNAAAD